jgi:hypothetical protein
MTRCCTVRAWKVSRGGSRRRWPGWRRVAVSPYGGGVMDVILTARDLKMASPDGNPVPSPPLPEPGDPAYTGMVEARHRVSVAKVVKPQ